MAALADGDLIDGKYKIVRFLGSGAWASVYEGVNARIGRRVAIKVLSDESMQKPGIVDRFEREAQAATRIDSDHVVHVFDLGVLADGRPYIVMELLEGHDLAAEIAKSGALTEHRAVSLVVQALRGLGDAHTAGVLHRDVKPDNIVLVKNKHGDEVVKIVDFGISKLHSGLQVSSMTQTNSILGSPIYMSPEQCRGARHMDHRSDLYSLGVVLFELLTTKLPHKAETFNELMFKIALEDPASPIDVRPELDPALSAIVNRALAREASERFQSAADFETALLDWARDRGIDPSSWAERRSKLRIVSGVDDIGLRETTLRPDSLSESSNRSVSRTLDRTKASATDPIAPAKTRRLGMMVGIGLALVVGIGVTAFATRGRPTAGSAATGEPSAKPPIAATVATTAPTVSIAATTTPSSSASVVEPVATVTTTTTPTTSPTLMPRRTSTLPTAQPHASATTTTTTTPATAAVPTPSVPTGSVVDGRRIHTDF